MTGYVNKFDKNDNKFNKNGNTYNKNVTMSFRINNNKQLLKTYNKICKKIEKLMNIDLQSKPVYGNDEKYIKTKIRIYADSLITNFQDKKMPKKSTIQVFIINNARFCY